MKAPAWWFAHKEHCLKSVPRAVAEMVALHVRGKVEIADVQGNTIRAESLGDGVTLDFDADRGLARSATIGTEAFTPEWEEDEDESDD